MNEVGEIMPTQDTSAEVGVKQVPEAGAGRGSVESDTSTHHEPESRATLENLRRATDMRINDPDNNQAEADPSERVRKELEELTGEKAENEKEKKHDEKDAKDKESKEKNIDEEPRDEIDELLKKEREEDVDKSEDELKNELSELVAEYVEFLGDGADEKLLKEAGGKGFGESKNKRPEMTLDIKALLKRMLAIVWAIIKYMFKLFGSGTKEENKKVTGEEIRISDEPFEGKEHEEEAIKQGLKEKRHADLVREFRNEKGDQSTLLAAADKIFAGNLYKIKEKEPQDLEKLVGRNKLLKGRIENKRRELLKRAVAKKMKAQR